MRIDINPLPVANQPDVGIFFGALSFKYTTLSQLVRESLLGGIGLGIAGSINWLETRLSGAPLGAVAGGFAVFAGLGALAAMALFIGIVEVNISPETVKEEYVKYLKAAYFLVGGTVIGYFGTVLQVRRVVDLRRENG